MGLIINKGTSYFKRVSGCVQAMRLKTLIVSISVWITGVGLSITHQQSISIFLNIIILMCMVCLQIAVNYFNDAIDFKRKKDTSSRLGPARMVQSGHISYRFMMRLAWLMLFFSSLLGAYLIYHGGWVICIIGILGILSAFFYSAPPLALADRGCSDIFVFLFFGLLAVGGIFYLNAVDTLSSSSPVTLSIVDRFLYFNGAILKQMLSAVIAGSQMGFLSMSLLVVNHLRDQEEDSRTGKKTWVVRKGRVFGFLQLACCIFIPYLLGYYWLIFESYEQAFIYPLCVLPFHVYIFYKVSQEDPSEKYNFYLALTSFGQLLFATALVLGWMNYLR